MPFNIETILEKAKPKVRERMKVMARMIAKEHPEVFRRGVAAWMEGKPTGRELTAKRKELASITDPDVFKAALEAEIKKTSEQEAFDMLYGGRS